MEKYRSQCLQDQNRDFLDEMFVDFQTISLDGRREDLDEFLDLDECLVNS